MRIAIFHELPVTSGSRKAVNHIAKELKKRNIVDLYLVDEQKEITETAFYSNIYFYKFSQTPWNGKNWKARLYRDTIELLKLNLLHIKIAKIIEANSYDICFVHGSKFVHSPFLLSHLKKIPTIYYAHASNYSLVTQAVTNLPQVDIFRQYYEKLNRFVQNYLDRNNVRNAQNIFANSKFTRERIKIIYNRKSKVAYLGVDTNIYKPLDSKKTQDILFIGSIQPVDGLDLINDAITLLKHKPTFKKLLIEKEWIKNEANLCKVYNSSKMVICTARQEPFGLTAIEAQSCGVPVIAVKEGGYKETVLDKKTGYLIERSAQKLAQKISQILTNKKLANKLAKNARIFTKDHWSWEKNVLKMEKMFKNIRYEKN